MSDSDSEEDHEELMRMIFGRALALRTFHFYPIHPRLLVCCFVLYDTLAYDLTPHMPRAAPPSDEYDTNESGQLNKDELRSLLEDLGFNSIREEWLAKVVRRLGGLDDRIDFEEFSVWWTEVCGPHTDSCHASLPLASRSTHNSLFPLCLMSNVTPDGGDHRRSRRRHRRG